MAMLAQFDPRSMDPKLQLLDLDRADCEESLYEFLKTAWKYIDPSPWKDGWPIAAVCEHLQAVVDGEIRRLIINIPPRCAKSSTTSVALPAWCWAQGNRGPTSGPGVPFLYASYADKLSLRDSVKCRRLIESPWYQRHWGNRYQLTTDQNTKSRFSNNQGGERLITSIGAGVTGEGGNIIVVDDPNAANEAFSEATIQSTIDWWDQTMPTRLNDMQTGAYIIIQQRLSENDLSGHILEKDSDNWTQLVLPMRFERDRQAVTSIGWKDPRSVEGELLWPERFSEESVQSLEKSMGPWISAGQLQQRPEPAGGGVIKSDWWKVWERDKFPPMDFVLGTLDTAYTMKTVNDPSAMIVWGVFSGEKAAPLQRVVNADHRQQPVNVSKSYEQGAPAAMMMHAWRERLEFHELVKKTVESAIALKIDVLLIENKAAGISVAQEIRRLYANEKFSVRLFDPKSQDKLSRLYSVQHLFSEGMIWTPERAWSDMVIREVGQFPKGKHDDLVDCVSMGLRTLRDMGMLARSAEKLAEYEALKIYPRGQNEPLYPV